ncbi:hypothetical protein U0070_014268 [Myodes glareolus]|uniref:Uncharacterized protein n=1 Tax=Myodes glareolus TaxID=447135 RepID=A0AAW0I1K3_MYOGA
MLLCPCVVYLSSLQRMKGCAPRVCSAQRGEKRASSAVEMELQMTVSQHRSRLKYRNKSSWANETAHWVKALAATAGDRRSIPGNQSVEGESRLRYLGLCMPYFYMLYATVCGDATQSKTHPQFSSQAATSVGEG